jgi:hypothetical protein
MLIPSSLSSFTVHYLLSEAMWSERRSSYGEAWTKAIISSVLLWSTVIASSTFVWRKVLPKTKWGLQVFHRYPIPVTPLEYRVMHTDKELLTGMGWTYWFFGMFSGIAALSVASAATLWMGRPHLLMSPNGYYSKNCLPDWRKEVLGQR